ncbi:hypothetical protein LTR10_014273 [Elasticomyces elasticus]|uniref:GDP/GTP exchange factor Sec2 N-terminal domain-containing protein n=1 Tax=Exophiala sideris TaxID=1016849 RepID=A0ABR0JII0_9EURO|nr:hypothetical protein LTR10_014273 [Elasticomyces elasticus]KAK5034314.1 hypothetical protein LTS07_003234 [Exophiala sideris]KAK5042611.1 hypothetical protein LTR13_001458 [Exophiala sideris]KAK5065693.1 hypothetical protein LTR69_003242 [Exophiala sideris]KAK5185849.1 hypothetical protein LTR44_001898 [Eurotiomycetes sp. CCFEE 6388]
MDPSYSTPTSNEVYASAAALAASSCPSCGYHFPQASDPSTEAAEAHRRIVRLLNSKAASAVDKLADYEDEIRYLREGYARSQQQGQRPSLEGPGPAVLPGQQQQQQQQPPHQLSRLASLSALLPGRRKESAGQLPLTPATGTFPQNSAAYANNTLSPPKTPFSGLLQSSHTQSDMHVPTLSSLQTSLEEERTLRLRAETSLSDAQTELEDLTAQLFGQANEMVATERRERAKLEERVKVLEQRDTEKRKRLERLEKAIARIERIRAMVGP